MPWEPYRFQERERRKFKRLQTTTPQDRTVNSGGDRGTQNRVISGAQLEFGSGRKCSSCAGDTYVHAAPTSGCVRRPRHALRTLYGPARPPPPLSTLPVTIWERSDRTGGYFSSNLKGFLDLYDYTYKYTNKLHVWSIINYSCLKLSPGKWPKYNIL